MVDSLPDWGHYRVVLKTPVQGGDLSERRILSVK